MYKLIIVDDEEEVRHGIVRKIAWEQYNFQISGEAENGREALDIIEEDIPDVVITDISMPIMNGLELASVLRESYPTVITVILTGYDDFKFAQQAIKYGVADYILKPVLPENITDVMEKLKARIDAEILRKKDMDSLRRHYKESLPIIRDNFLLSLVTGRSVVKDAEKKIMDFNLRLSGNRFIAAVSNIDSSSMKDAPYGENDFELLKFAVSNISQEIADKHSFGEVFSFGDNLVIAAGFAENDASIIIGKFYSMLEEIRQNVEKYLKVTVTIGMGSVFDSVTGLRDAYRRALSALEYRLVLESNKVIFIEDVEPKNAEAIFLDDSKERNLVYGIKFGTDRDITEAVNALFRDIGGVQASMKEHQLYFLELIASISRLSREFQFGITEILGSNSNLYAEISGFETLDEIRVWIEGICIKIKNHISDKRLKATKMLLDKAQDYIHLNYSDNELSLQKVADYLHISSSYLSMIFKKEAGETFLKYLVGIRLDAAKDLLRNSDMKSAEIAEKIGYPDINYFSYFFKKNLSMSPREYRNNYLNAKESSN